jgi:hypothetical protein
MSMGNRLNVRRVMVAGLLVAAVAASGCGTAPAATSSVGPTSSASVASPTADATPAASPSAAASVPPSTAPEGSCLSADVVAALDELDSGNLETDPSITEVADALEALDLDGAAADARDAAVARLREEPPSESFVVSALLGLRTQVRLPEC